MSDKAISNIQLIKLMNDALSKHPEFKDGMRIFLYPEGCAPENASGIGWSGPLDKRGVFAAAMHAVDMQLIPK